MYRQKKFDVWASEIAGYLSKELQGEDFRIADFRAITCGPGTKKSPEKGEVPRKAVLLIARNPIPGFPSTGFIQSDAPELDLAFVLREFFASQPVNEIHPTAIISPGARIGRNVLIGAHSIIGPDVTVGDNTKILGHVTINGFVTIGKLCVLKDGAVIGSEGWGFIKDEDGVPFHPPQLGHILIGDRVWIGSNTTVERAMVEDTVIDDDAKIDDLVHIGGGSHIGLKCEVTAGVVISSNVILGMNVRIAPNAVVREDLCVGENVLIGQGAVVVKSLARGEVYVGNPARPIGKRSTEKAKK